MWLTADNSPLGRVRTAPLVPVRHPLSSLPDDWADGPRLGTAAALPGSERPGPDMAPQSSQRWQTSGMTHVPHLASCILSSPQDFI